jgi:hypothetical protein
VSVPLEMEIFLSTFLSLSGSSSLHLPLDLSDHLPCSLPM